MSSDKNYERAKRVARTILNEFATPNAEQFSEAIAAAKAVCPNVDVQALSRDLETLYNVLMADGTVLQDPTQHEAWLTNRIAHINWDFWSRYQLYLEQEKQMPPLVLARLNDSTDRILGLLEDPQRPGPWDRRGMVVGQVQSGKTSNYTGLICKAADAGYKLIIVMAGIHNSLRSQTQLRLDSDFLGRDTKQDRVFNLNSPHMGVGYIKLVSGRTPAAHSLTTSDERGDFKAGAAKSVAPYVGNDPVILVIKKNGSILKNLLKWVTANLAEVKDDKKIVPNKIPLLLLDDEADNASINTKRLEQKSDGKFEAEQDVTKINGLIRKLLDTFTCSAYVGYTATPFANIFIPPDAITKAEGEDLFPRSFIINLPAPSNYIGPVQVFGLAAKDSEAPAGLPIVRPVLDSEEQFPGEHKKDLTPTALPASLKEAIRAFILSCAARQARGQAKQHNSMLIHVTRFVAVQHIVRDLVLQEKDALRRRLEYGDGSAALPLRDELRELWQRDFAPTSESVRGRLSDDSKLTPLTWEQIEPHLTEAAAKIQVKEINGTAKDVLDYYDQPDGSNVIAIGGDKLSRGLTLEGLSVSYYLRATRMYDTLMQMGRWFGYRPGYADLCRLYTTPDLTDWYKHITLASEELREDFDAMAAQGLTPADYGLKVQTHPGGLMVTSAGKIRYGTVIKILFSGQLIETFRLSKAKSVIDANFAATELLIQQLGSVKKGKPTDNYVWKGVSAELVIDYLNALQISQAMPTTPASNPAKLAEFIRRKHLRQELTDWTVALIDSITGENPKDIGGIKGVKLPKRSPDRDSTDATYIIRNRHILTESHEWLDLSNEEKASAIAKRNEMAKAKDGDSAPTFNEPNGKSVRTIRPKTRGLLLLYPLDPAARLEDKDNPGKVLSIFPDGDARASGNPVMGFAISFPESDSSDGLEDAVEYVVTSKYFDEEVRGYKQEEEWNNDAK